MTNKSFESSNGVKATRQGKDTKKKRNKAQGVYDGIRESEEYKVMIKK